MSRGDAAAVGPILEGRVAVVTGASRGLGRAAAVALDAAGAFVVLSARDESALAQTAGLLRNEHLVVPTDVTKREDVYALVNRALAAFTQVDVVVNNAGVAVPKPFLETKEHDWDLVVETDLKSLFYMMQAVGPHLVERKTGKVINISSVFAKRGAARYSSYCMCKAGVIGFTQALAVEWARYGVQVNAIAPGYFSTDANAELSADPARLDRILRHIPARRMATAEEIAGTVVFLASDAADYVTGETIVIDGGFTRR